MNRLRTLSPFLAVLVFLSCSKINTREELPADKANLSIQTNPGYYSRIASNGEDFEAGSKTSYTAGNVTLASGTWNLNDALIGNSTSDRKNGVQPARMRNSGKLTMMFDHPNGASTLTVMHATFGSDSISEGVAFFCHSMNAGSKRFPKHDVLLALADKCMFAS